MKMDAKELAAIHAACVRTDIPYTQLRISQPYQARRAGDAASDSELAELKAMIRAIGGLLQNLGVVATPEGDYEVCAGGRRFIAIGMLIDEGFFGAAYAVPCLIIAAERVHHASLIENIARRAMHPADVFESYARPRADGWTLEAIAAAHGANANAVKKLLALFRQDKISLEEMQALAAVGDHARQDAAWKATKQGYFHHPCRIRELLSKTEMRGDNKVARYVTVAVYEKAGGSVRRDLFEDDVYLDDPEKVRSMALAKMQRSKLAKSVAAEG